MTSDAVIINKSIAPGVRQNTPTKRLTAIDGLRGIAAMMVVLYHLSSNLYTELASDIPSWILAVLQEGYLGVPIFFVLSGFVISLSIKSDRVDIKYIGRFALKRSIRLDPAYWSAILLAIALLFVKDYGLGSEVAYPDSSDLMFHVFYLQDIVGTDYKISPVFWTLCIEIQFYLFYIFSVYLFHSKNWFNVDLLVLFLLFTAIISLLSHQDLIVPTIKGWFIPYWHYFVLGIFVQRSINIGKKYYALLAILASLEIAAISIGDFSKSILIALITATYIFSMGITKKLAYGLNIAPIQFLGAISYSLYLVHPDIGWKSISLIKEFLYFPNVPFFSVIALIAGTLISIVGAYIFYYLIERTSLKLSKRIAL